MDKIDERYENGKIYTIRCRYDDDLIYVGTSRAKSLLYLVGKERICNNILS